MRQISEKGGVGDELEEERRFAFVEHILASCRQV